MEATGIAQHFEQALADVALAIAPHSERIGCAVVSYYEPGSWLNQCWNFGMQGAVTADDVDRVIAFYDSHQCEALVGLATVADPSAAKALAGRGFELSEFINMLVADLSTDRTTPHTYPAPTGLDIQRVDKSDGESIDRWAELSTRGFNDGAPAPSAEVWTAAQALRYDGDAIPPILALELERKGDIGLCRTIYCGSFSKTLSPGLRVGCWAAWQAMP